jgi:glycogen synthase
LTGFCEAAAERTSEGAGLHMHVLMLGWEFPPFITGGLGTACHGLTRAMDRRGTRVTFVLPKPVNGEHDHADHVTLLTPLAAGRTLGEGMVRWMTIRRGEEAPTIGAAPLAGGEAAEFANVRFLGVPAEFTNPYQAEDVGVSPPQRVPGPARTSPASPPGAPAGASATTTTAASRIGPSVRPLPHDLPPPPAFTASDYDGDMIGQAERYAWFCLAATRHIDFDVIHAHDWMTYPAGLLIARHSGKPLVVHIHSTEFDRSGEHVNQRVYDIERRGMHGSMRVIAVSQLTKNVVMNRYGLPDHRVEVVYNGVDLEPGAVGMTGIRSKDKIVLYFGRITYQKGPEYFIQAAKRVLEVMEDVKFVVAGSGDQAKRMIELAAELGIGHKVLFTGFLRGNDIKRVFALADLYVMPSVSEPFGIAPLEAMSHNVPVLISKSSGVSEVLTHALKVDFWDIEDMANKIIAVLRYPPLSQTLQEHGAFEVRTITWDGAAERCENVYRAVINELRVSPA